MDQQLLSFLQRALAAEHGVKLKTDEPHRLIFRLSAVRKEAIKTNPDYGTLVIVVSRTDPKGQVWIARRQPEPVDAQEE